jgi:peptidoglycan-associated lipoprotein
MKEAMMTERSRFGSVLFGLGVVMLSVACHGKKPPVATPTPPPTVVADPTPIAPPPPAPQPPAPPPPTVPPNVPLQPLAADDITAKDLDTLNKEQFLKPIFFAYDRDDIDAAGQAVLVANAQLMKKYDKMTITIEGHSDERGTAEYNLALGERRALTTKSALVILGISADRIKTVSYGKEFPFDPGHDEAAFANNRRAHFVVTAK